MSGEKSTGFGDVHPGEETRVAGGVGLAVIVDAADAQMDVFNALNQQSGVVTIAEGGHGDELAGAPQAAHHILAEVGVIPDPRQRGRMQHL